MKRIRIDLKKLNSSSKQPKEFSKSLLEAKMVKRENGTSLKPSLLLVKGVRVFPQI